MDPRTLGELDRLASTFSQLRETGPVAFQVLFSGPSGTGKTLAATTLGDRLGVNVIHIDLSEVVSKFIGETEKNLSALFDKAEQSDAILFFDEADALFRTRGSDSTAGDRLATTTASFLLQRIEDFTGVAILATNNASALDPAFVRRSHSIITFARPPGSAVERHVLDG